MVAVLAQDLHQPGHARVEELETDRAGGQLDGFGAWVKQLGRGALRVGEWRCGRRLEFDRRDRYDMADFALGAEEGLSGASPGSERRCRPTSFDSW